MDLTRHPMRREERPRIIVRPMHRLGQAFATALEFGRPSLRMRGPGRAGKSTAEELLRELRAWRPFPLGFLYTIAGKSDRPTEAKLYRDLALGLKLRQSKNASGNEALSRIANAVEEEAGRACASTVVLTIDHAEHLTLDDYEGLARLQTMFARGTRLFFLFIVQSDASPEGCDALEHTLPPHIRGRFFVDKYEHTGLLWSIHPDELNEVDACDVALACREYDNHLRWPVKDGPTFVEAWAPGAYRDGWRLESQVDDIKRVADLMSAGANLAVMPDWLMVSFEPFVYCCLVRIAAGKPSFRKLKDEDIQRALTAAAFVAFEQGRQRAKTS